MRSAYGVTQRPNHDETVHLWRCWHTAAGDARVDEALRAFYGRLDEAISARPGHCELSGRCCRFDTFDHRLYVTGLEVAWLLRHLDAAGRQMFGQSDPTQQDGCPFQIDRICGVHGLRPMGCRIFFCDSAAQYWQGPLYEHLLSDLRRLHETHRVPYRYMEWRVALAEAQASGFE